jgi:predicted MFS family arabinose efflux permease
MSLNHGALISHILPLFEAQSFSSEAAVFAASMIGPMQVVGRLVMISVERRLSAIGIGVVCLLSMAAAATCLLFASGQVWLAVAFVVLHGAGYGVTSILKPVIIADLLGRQNFGAVSGWLALPLLGGSAAAPMLAAGLWGFGGTDMVIIAAITAALVGLVSLSIAARISRNT